eukprot:GEZU01010507.1.p2 GENE.GEZU01010507.1~~GEZU01010507.1.p2  ORF type:complete len:164 (-),score=41.19 GEZU01010507.1:491-982(-)
MDWAGQQLGIHTLDDWYAVAKKDVEKLGGTRLLRGYYNCSLQPAVYKWLPWGFRKTSKGFWRNDMSNHRLFMDWAGEQLGIRDLDDWYSITVEDVVGKLAGGSSLLREYGNSLQRVLSAVYPHHPWLPWRFKHVRTFGDPSNQKLFMEWAGEQLGVRKAHLDD